MLSLLLILGLVAGAVIPVQTSINSRLSRFTQSSLYASAISFTVGTLLLVILNFILNPHLLTAEAFGHYHFDYYWYVGGLMGVIYLTGNMILLPRIGASLTVVTTITGQILMSMLIDTFGWFSVDVQALHVMKVLGIVLLLIGIILMNLQKNAKQLAQSGHNGPWMLSGMIIGFTPPIQTAINSHLGQTLHSPFFASLVSFTVGASALIILTLMLHRHVKIHATSEQHGPLKWWHFVGGALGVIFVTTNIILTPVIGVTFTLITVMVGQIIMGLLIDHFGLFGVPHRHITKQRLLGFMLIIIAIIIIQFN
ncbi:DMT family transporter [Staphylococcus pseudintermedius]|uniref:DMT family transporter n=1 Tax=Staphylococcus pseudintermedius TaxID=283734 RepID=A0A8H9BXR9_STAPS|nr:DMT family transporter [Staphylococcus pseudintermedius]EGQ0318872.1 DMT family transporter [Staphylococcus pseudintermedius]EGQ0383650.1 DMT family transporter [Staphylococcus pseudintermedius]EGQ1285148.1 EamA-like transporter family protein [Staphylococcus pseudintermedius]EGQ1317995.1 EamA-like transporter family protein [Staphylococcus pseudintermedius]EGQ2727170.1 DMT family transporter [Staphylococcus pseudintermedius]